MRCYFIHRHRKRAMLEIIESIGSSIIIRLYISVYV
nr:MAG TPA: hypothetical protein [Caudoviricetes sp.]